MEAKKTISTAQDQAKAFIEAQKDDARKQAEEIISKAKIAMDQERERVLMEAREEIASLVVLTASKVLSKDLSDEEKEKFSSRATQELNIAS